MCQTPGSALAEPGAFMYIPLLSVHDIQEVLK